MDRVMGMSSKALLRNFEYITMNRLDIIEWMTKKWNPLIKYTPKINMFLNGWICFHFLTEERMHVISSKF